MNIILFLTRSEANNVLKEAVQVTRELDKAAEAQKGAEKAIEKATEDITGADTDLKQVHKTKQS